MSKVFTITDGLENLGALRTGGQGSVYKGRRTGTIYSAVKLIPTPVFTEDNSDKNYQHFQSEVAKLQRVNEVPNPNVVKILSFGITESGSFPYIEMEYIEGPDLGELLQAPHDKIFAIKDLIKVADQLACALLHCHNAGVKHGDIKSNNVKYNIHTGNYILLDFGLAILSEEQRRSSIRHAGAIEFMAPEQHEGKMFLQTDVYSYGVILYELLTGQVPFPLHGDGDTGRNTVIVGHMEGDIPDAMQLRATNLPPTWDQQKKEQEMQVPEWLLKLIYKCLQKNHLDRYASGNEIHQAIVAGTIVPAAVNTPVSLSELNLRKQNEQLQQELLQYKAAGNTDKVTLSKAKFAGLLAISLIFFSLFVYAFFIKPKKVVVDDNVPVTSANAKPYRSPFIFIKYYNHDSVLQVKKRDSIAKVKRQQALKPKPVITKSDTANEDKKPEKKKKKRKKFLGIF